MKKILSFILCALMVLAIVPVSVFMVSAEAGDANTLYANEFDTALNPNGGSKSGDVTIETNEGAQNGTYYLDTKGMRLGGGASWTEPVALDNNSGELVIKMRYYNNNNNGTALSINGVAIAGGTSSGIPTIGGVNAAASAKAWRVIDLTVTITDLSTGEATVEMKDMWASYSGTATVGKITDSITLKVGSFGNSFKVDSLTVTQVHVEEEPDQPDQPDPEPEIPTDLFSTGAKSYQNAANQSDTYTITPNGTAGDITLVLSYVQTNWQRKSSILKINGKTVFWGNGAQSNPGYSLGDDAAVYNTWSGRTVTVVIDPLTGDATISDGVGNSATTNVGVIGKTFNIVVGQDYAHSWNLTSLTVNQEAPAAPETERNVWIDGYQKTAIDGGKYNVRFVAGVGELVAGQELIGFEISVPAQGKSWDKVTSTVYNSITANYGTKTVLASAIGAKYITALAITGIPEELGVIEFVVRPYTVINGETVYGTAVTVSVNPHAESSEEEALVKKAVLLLGQSNMAGRGDVNSVEKIDDDRIYMMRNLTWMKMEEPIFTDKPTAGVGPAASFAKAYVETYGETLGLIPGAVGGTSLAEWAVGGTLYNNAVAMANKAIAEGTEIVAILWHQGESDTTNNSYSDQLKAIIDALYVELGLDTEAVPFITGELFEQGLAEENRVGRKFFPLFNYAE